MSASVASDVPWLWFLNRSTGMVVLVALTLSVALGCLGAGRNSGGVVPAFLPQHLHRNLSVLALVLTGIHAMTAVIDSYVDIRWWQVFSPVGATYEPLWLGLGTLAFDIMIIVSLTTWMRRRLPARAWHAVHLVGYLTWPVALAHGAGIGTDAMAGGSVWLGAACLATVALAVASRLSRLAAALRDVDTAGHLA